MSGTAVPSAHDGGGVAAGEDAPFDAPWQLRAFALSRALVESGAVRPADIRDALAAELAAHPERAYWDSFVAAIERVAAPGAPSA